MYIREVIQLTAVTPVRKCCLLSYDIVVDVLHKQLYSLYTSEKRHLVVFVFITRKYYLLLLYLFKFPSKQVGKIDLNFEIDPV